MKPYSLLHRWTLALVMAAPVAMAQYSDERAPDAALRDSHSGSESSQAAEANRRLRQLWQSYRPPAAGVLPAAPSLAPEAESLLPEAQRRAPALESTASFQEPEEIRSSDGKLVVTLVGRKAYNHIGADPVYLRSYNGRLVGPTLRVRPGDTLRITLKNELAPQPDAPDTMDTLHGFNTMNLHTHGLHVSPWGNSDNVLLEVSPQSTQDYEIVIPKNHPAGTFWYHAHNHGSTAAQVGSGMSGALIIAGGLDEVPEIAKATERVMVLQQIPYIYNDTFTNSSASGDNLFVTNAIDCFTNIGTLGAMRCTTNVTQSGSTNITTIVCTHFGYRQGEIEERDSGFAFGPGQWEAMGRYTTVNGVKLPVIRVRPLSVERWRFIDSGVREEIKLTLRRVDRPGAEGPETIPFHEIAVDGLALGKIVSTTMNELWPGYRSDVLVKFPNAPGTEYLLTDAPDLSGTSGSVKSLKYIARVVIAGAAEDMALPNPSQLAKYRLPSIPPSEITGPTRTMHYGILLANTPSGIEFTVNEEPFNMTDAVGLTLGKAEDWMVYSSNHLGFPIKVSHPFHIHVNPFEVYSMKDEHGVEHLTNGPVWRDTLVMNEQWTNRFRTRYTDFTGLFVQHCHILDHEDQGMMKLVQITNGPTRLASLGGSQDAVPVEGRIPRMNPAYAAPAWQLPDAEGKRHELAEFRGRPLLLFFYEGYRCLKCNQQIALFTQHAREFREHGLEVVGISTDGVEDLRKGLEAGGCPFLLLADPRQTAFRQYGCHAGGPLHGTFLVDAGGRVQWQEVSPKPFLGVQEILESVERIEPRLVRAE